MLLLLLMLLQLSVNRFAACPFHITRVYYDIEIEIEIELLVITVIKIYLRQIAAQKGCLTHMCVHACDHIRIYMLVCAYIQLAVIKVSEKEREWESERVDVEERRRERKRTGINAVYKTKFELAMKGQTLITTN